MTAREVACKGCVRDQVLVSKVIQMKLSRRGPARLIVVNLVNPCTLQKQFRVPSVPNACPYPPSPDFASAEIKDMDLPTAAIKISSNRRLDSKHIASSEDVAARAAPKVGVTSYFYGFNLNSRVSCTGGSYLRTGQVQVPAKFCREGERVRASG